MAPRREDLADCLAVDFMESNNADMADRLIVFLASGLSPTRENRERPVFMRHSWASRLEGAAVVAVADPCQTLHPEINGAFYMHPELDVIELLASFVGEKSRKIGIAPDDVTFYGSSYGGFAAIGLAAHLEGARAIAECPQIDIANWLPSMVDPLQEHVIGPIEVHRKNHPEQVSLKSRLRKADHVPPYRLITNPTELRYREQIDFYHWSDECSLPRTGYQELFLTNKVRKHAALSVDDALPHMSF